MFYFVCLLKGPDGIIKLSEATEEDWENYCQRMAQAGEWADALVVVAMAQMLQHDILILTSSPQTSDEQFYNWIYGAPNFKGRPIVVGHEYEYHYQSLEAMSKMT